MDELLIGQTETIEDLAGREGFDENFLGQPVPLTALAGAESVLLPYTYFSVLMRLDKRLAAVTGVGIDGEKLMDLDRSGIKWRLDPRAEGGPADGGAGLRPERHRPRPPGPPGFRCLGRHTCRGSPGLCRHLPLHERRPQAAKFNQDLELWLSMESYLLDHAADNRRRLVVFTGPIFSLPDPVYRGVDNPLRYFKPRSY